MCMYLKEPDFFFQILIFKYKQKMAFEVADEHLLAEVDGPIWHNDWLEGGENLGGWELLPHPLDDDEGYFSGEEENSD